MPLFFTGQARAAVLTMSVVSLLCVARPAPADEYRGLWVDAWHAGFMSAAEVASLVNTCKTYNYNSVVVQMRRRGDAWYMPSGANGEPRTTALPAGYDALAEVINQCHAASPRIEVHCWVPTMLIWSSTTPPSQPGHVYNTHPEYLMKNSAGAAYMSEGYYLDPGHPGAMMWNFNMAADIVSRYDIDGFHWDYVRYPTTDAGYNATALARYNAEYGLAGQPSPTDAQFASWRRRQITDFLRWTSAELLAIKPGIVLSASVFSSRSDAYNNRYQDWAAWNAEGLVDLCMPMTYTSDSSLFNSRVDDIFANQGVRWTYVGQGAYLNTKENTLAQLNYVRSKGFSGIQLYSYAVPNSGTVNQAATFGYLQTNFQSTYQSTPLLPWKAAPSKGIVKGIVTNQQTGAPIYNATVTMGAPDGRSRLTEPHGRYAFFEAAPGTYTVSATAPDMGTATGQVQVVAGQVAGLNLAVPPKNANEIVVDNLAAAVSGNWSTGTTAADRFGPDYRFKDPGRGREYVTFTPNLPAGGTWEVSEWHSAGTNRSTSTPHIVRYGRMQKTINVNQQLAGGRWNSLGVYSFSAGTSGYVKITDRIPSGSYVAIADAMKFVPVPPPDVIVDNSSSSFRASSKWTTDSSSADKYGTSCRLRNTGAVTDMATWTVRVPVTGNYEVYAWWSQGAGRSASAPYIVYHAAGSQTVSVNQQGGGGAWQSLGTYRFNAGSNRVRLSCNTAPGAQVCADAVRLAAR